MLSRLKTIRSRLGAFGAVCLLGVIAVVGFRPGKTAPLSENDAYLDPESREWLESIRVTRFSVRDEPRAAVIQEFAEFLKRTEPRIKVRVISEAESKAMVVRRIGMFIGADPVAKVDPLEGLPFSQAASGGVTRSDRLPFVPESRRPLIPAPTFRLKQCSRFPWTA